jgi:ABC-2 type transport system permease protein
MQQADTNLYWLSEINPFTHAVELIRFALYERLNAVSALIVTAYLAVFMTLAVIGYDPGRGLIARRAGAE